MTPARRRGGPLPIDLTERGSWTTWTLTAAQVETLRDTKLLDIRSAGRGPGGEQWRLRAGPVVGAVRLGTRDGAVQLRIAPKVPVDRLLHLLAYAPDKAHWDPDPVDAAERRGLLTTIASRFADAAEQVVWAGLLAGYREKDDTSMMLRGRLRTAAQLRRGYGLVLPLEVSYDEHTIDIPENQLLLGATRRLTRLADVEPAVRARLRKLDALLDGVNAPAPGAPAVAWTPTRLNARYKSALRLAEIVLRGATFEYTDGRRISVDGLLVNMEKIYEEFLTKATGAVLERRLGGRSQPHPRTHFLDDRRRHILLPDLVHQLPDESGGLRPAVVVDAKYQNGIKRDDLYQMLAYCTCFGLSEGHLVAVAGKHDGTVVRVPAPSGIITLYRHVVDLSLPPHALDSRLEALVETIIDARTVVSH